MNKKTALITGASSGIGFEIAKCLAKKGFDLVITARNKKKLENAAEILSHVAEASVEVVVADLHDPLAPEAIYNYCQKKRT